MRGVSGHTDYGRPLVFPVLIAPHHNFSTNGYIWDREGIEVRSCDLFAKYSRKLKLEFYDSGVLVFSGSEAVTRGIFKKL